MPRTGPKTPRGKAVSSRNAFKHGIHSNLVVVDDLEEFADWEALRDGIRDSLQPENILEELLTERIALNFWRRRRVDCFQAAVTRIWLDDAWGHLDAMDAFKTRNWDRVGWEPDERDLHIQKGIRILPMDDHLQKIMRYDSHLHRQTIQLLHELEAMKALRKGVAAPLTRLDITGSDPL